MKPFHEANAELKISNAFRRNDSVNVLACNEMTALQYSRVYEYVARCCMGVLFTCKAVTLCTHCYTLLGIHS